MMRSFNLLNVLLKDGCNISDNKSMFYFRAFIFLGLSLHAVPNYLFATFQDNTDNNFAAIHHKNDLISTYY